MLTGQRRGELALARWKNVDLKAKTWTIPNEDAKAGKGHVVPLTDWAVQEFEALKALAKHSAFVLPDDTEAHEEAPWRHSRFTTCAAPAARDWLD